MKFIKPGLAILFLGLIFSACSKIENRPNVIIILTDDQGWGDIASHGNPEIYTPNLDALAADGARFNRFFVSPVCAPTRASLLTGRDHLRTGTQWVTYGLENMNAEEVTFGEVFKQAGYKTGLFGKWHNGSHYPMDPIGQGFDTFFGFKQGHWNNYFDTELEYNGESVKTEGFITDVLTDSALAFIERNQHAPFLAFIPYNAPHSPFQVPDKYFDKYKEQGMDDKNASVYGMVENIDDNVGRIVDTLDELDIADNTIVIFLTDNGPNGGDRFNGNMKGWKAKVDEGGVRVPLFIKWPKKIPAGTVVEELTAHIDFLPSIVELAGIEFEEENPLDGRSFTSLIFEDTPLWSDRYLFTHQSRWDSLEMYPASVRNNQYRAVRYNDHWELFDMNKDPGQQNDISESNPLISQQFANVYDDWFEEVTKDLPQSRPVQIGHQKAPIVQLPAVESSFTGNIKFNGISGWSNDWIINWRTTEDEASWEIDVVEEGTYETLIEYSLGNAENGLLATISINGEDIISTQVSSYQAQLVFSPDRVARGEVYEKKWGLQSLGESELKTGIQNIEISILPIAETASSFELKNLIIKKKI